jgi:cytochrome c oxidase subunit I+III
MLFVLGFIFIFTLGGLTGVMVAMVPFDQQAHDTYFVVAHFHYVLIGGMVFPLFAAIYYWMPIFGHTPLSERIGRWAFALMFVGFNVAFFTMHLTGLRGMPRRVYTYPEELGWGTLNMISTVGAAVFAFGVLLIVIDLIWRFRMTERDEVGNLWNAGTLEWLPNDNYGIRSVPIVEDRYPLWEQPGLPRDVEAGRYFLPGAPTGGRETLATSAVEASPEFVMRLPNPGWPHVAAAVFTALMFLSLTVSLVVPAVCLGLAALGSILVWLWDTDPGPDKGMVPIADDIRVPTYVTGPNSISWWAMVLLMFVGGALYLSFVFSYLYLWSVSPQAWPVLSSLPPVSWPMASAALLSLSALLLWSAGRALPEPGQRGTSAQIMLALAAVIICASTVVDAYGYLRSGLKPSSDSYSALTFLAVGLQAQLVATLFVSALYLIARLSAGLLDRQRRLSFETVQLLWWYATGQGIFGLLLLHGFPRLVGQHP